MNYNYLASGEFIKKNIDKFDNSQNIQDINDIQLFACGKNVCGVFDNENYLCSEPCDGISWEKIDDDKLAELKEDDNEHPNIINTQQIHNIKTNIKNNNIKLPAKQTNNSTNKPNKPTSPTNKLDNPTNFNNRPTSPTNFNNRPTNSNNTPTNFNNRPTNFNNRPNSPTNKLNNQPVDKPTNQPNKLNNQPVDKPTNQQVDNNDNCDNTTDIIIKTLQKTYEDQIIMVGKIYEERIASIPIIYQQQIDILNKTYQQQINNMSGNKSNQQFKPHINSVKPAIIKPIMIDIQLNDLRKAQNEYKDIMNGILQQKNLEIVNQLIQICNKQWDNILKLFGQYNAQKQPVTMQENILLKGLEFEALYETLKIASLRLSPILLSSMNNNINVIITRYKELDTNPIIKQIIKNQSQLLNMSELQYNNSYLIPRKNNYKKIFIYDW